MFSDEKVFSVNGGLNKQNDRIYATSREQANSYDGKRFYLKLLIFLLTHRISN